MEDFEVKDEKLFLGTWTLIPELCIYEAGSVPASCDYTISEDSNGFHFQVRWQVEAAGVFLKTSFAGVPDGYPRPLLQESTAVPPALTTLALTCPKENTLASMLFDQGILISSARRTASYDGTLLTVIQEHFDKRGSATKNIQIYRRKNS
jgi:hypothetical protein